ncbi:glycerate kinase [Kineosporia sp. J2-2]|uniref:Glycerate kinase n=1 Tax=Kineosporia corallincola TaxID=2835133 RepID=A0ABS5TD45_9ACTN|nr:glycerate kinase [Kineosporia corallincola]MBT0769009.1 glycerate kinase [Kineosporia corallincola]
MGHVLVAVDKFKGSLDGRTANAALARGLRRARPDLPVRVREVADGGDGTLAVLLDNGFRAVAVDVTGPTMVPRRSLIGLRGDEAFVELAEVCGLVHLPGHRLDGMRSTTWGLGLAVRAALDLGARGVHLAIGGSASTDGGLGLLTALGAVATDASGAPVTPDAAGLLRVTALDLSGLDRRLTGARIVAVTDVHNRLTGPQGAAHVYGPQKGLTEDQIPAVDAALGTWAELLHLDPAQPGTGAAGGVGAGVVGGLGGRLVPGAPYVLDATGFDADLPGASLVVTGEGSWDEQSPHGKAPAEVLRRARAAGLPTALVAGRVSGHDLLRELGVHPVTALTELAGGSAEVAMRDAERLLELAGTRLGNGLPRSG